MLISYQWTCRISYTWYTFLNIHVDFQFSIASNKHSSVFHKNINMKMKGFFCGLKQRKPVFIYVDVELPYQLKINYGFVIFLALENAALVCYQLCISFQLQNFQFLNWKFFELLQVCRKFVAGLSLSSTISFRSANAKVGH